MSGAFVGIHITMLIFLLVTVIFCIQGGLASDNVRIPRNTEEGGEDIDEGNPFDFLSPFPLLIQGEDGIMFEDGESSGYAPEANPDTEAEANVEAETAAETGTETEHKEETEPDVESEPETQTESETIPDAETEPEIEAEPEKEIKPDTDTEPRTESELKSEPESTPEDDNVEAELITETVPVSDRTQQEPESQSEYVVNMDSRANTDPNIASNTESGILTETTEDMYLLPLLPELLDCQLAKFGCCPDSDWPQHGPLGEGCCLNSSQGCCDDFLRARESGCDCEESMFGCCQDGVTAKLGHGEDSGCGCQESDFGCCQDQYTPAAGSNFAGCPCGTTDYGCCEDGHTVAMGPNGEGCSGCHSTEYGCCGDGFTPASGPGMEGCGCAGSYHGCCPDGVTEAMGEEFEGCEEFPGEVCKLPMDEGQGQNYTILWYFDINEGRCSRFWYGGQGGNRNRFPSSEHCESICISPPGSAMCYLPKVEGICNGEVEMWHYDQKYKQCNAFQYGGCLGNANRFERREDCEKTCVRTTSLSVCEQPLDPGPCRGHERRWYYDDQLAQCSSFNYGGCHGNKNRFMTQEACENSCGHQGQIAEATRICKQPLDSGDCDSEDEDRLEARWGFSTDTRSCVPFYFKQCGGNQNNFITRAECQKTCPNAFPPELEIVNKILNIEEGKEAHLRINVSGNPFPDIYWQHAGQNVVWGERVMLLQDQSVMITRVQFGDEGTWMVMANNGLGQVVRKQISLTVYPSSIPITVEVPMTKIEYDAGEDVVLNCQVEGYPVPRVTWLKNNARLPRSQRIVVMEHKTLVIKQASPIDSGAYICRAQNKNGSNQAVVVITVHQGEIPVECTDQPELANCDFVVKRQQCNRSPALARICCKSCHEAGQIAGTQLR